MTENYSTENYSTKEQNEQHEIRKRLEQISVKIVVLSGKGGVGKSTVAVNLATSLMQQGYKTGLLDADIHGPSIPAMLGLENEKITNSTEGLEPIELGELKVMSLGFWLPNPDDAVIWRGPMKMGIISQFIKDVNWGELDFLIIDSPPGTGDEPLSICQLIGDLTGAIVVTTPQKIAALDVRKSVSFCQQLKVPVLGVIENMNGFICPGCGKKTEILPSGSGRAISREMNVPWLGSIPMDPQIAQAADKGKSFIFSHPDSVMAEIFTEIIAPLHKLIEQFKLKGEKIMKIAIPFSQGRLSAHFGHCESFIIFEVDQQNRTIKGQEILPSPPHEPGKLPAWLAEKGAELIIAGGMGQRAQDLFSSYNIKVMVGAPSAVPEEIITDYLNNRLTTGTNVCDH